jgi:hypothetical protein
VWDNENYKEEDPTAVLDDYATVYLFFQWLRLQSGSTDIYKEIISSTDNDYNAVVNAMGYDDWETLLKTWLAANYILAPTGPYGYEGEAYFHDATTGIKAKTVPGGTFSVDLYPGEGVYSVTNSEYTNMPSPGVDIKYAGLDKTTPSLSDSSIFADGWLLTYNVDTNIEDDEDNPLIPESGTTTGVAANVVRALSSRSAGKIPEGPFAISASEMLKRNGHLQKKR